MLTFPGNCVLTLMLQYAWGWGGVGHVNVPWQLRPHVDATVRMGLGWGGAGINGG